MKCLAVLSCLLLTLLPCRAQLSSSYVVVRADYQNLTSQQSSAQTKNPGVTPILGHIEYNETAPKSASTRLPELSFGQPLAQWSTDDGSYAAQVVSDVRDALYPDPMANRAAVLASTAAFRYKSLLFSPEPGEIDITNHFESIDSWFGEAERSLANAQIPILQRAIAHSPFHTGLRHALLDVYYDLAVAEMQFAKKKLAELAVMRLGFVQTGPFIIDNEIVAYEELTAKIEEILGKYRELLSETMDGVSPSDFDPDPRVASLPMGHYIFIRSQKGRNATASAYVDADGGGLNSVPTLGTDPDGDGPLSPPVEDRPANEVLFSGYKDYTTLLTIQGNYIQYHAELARLRGMRQGSGDLQKALMATCEMQTTQASDYLSLRNLFPEVTFPPGDASGVNAAYSLVDTALAEIANVRSFLSGKSNMLGLDPEFLLLVQDPQASSTVAPRASFDILRARLKGQNQPLTVALNRMNEAEDRYHNFRASVDRVVQELADVEEAYETRFEEITGYGVDESPGFNGVVPKPSSGSELEILNSTEKALDERIKQLGGLSEQLGMDLESAKASVTTAEGLRTGFLNAAEVYREESSQSYLVQQIASSVAAAAQAGADAALTGLSLDPGNVVFSGGGTAVAIGTVGALNAIAQIGAVVVDVESEKTRDLASLKFDTEIEKLDAELTVNSAKQELGAIKRERYAQHMELIDTQIDKAEVVARKAALMGELRRIETNRKGNTADVRSKYYADPIHYIRAEEALITADEAFRNAQRWLFYTQRALEYKWQQTFAIAEGSKAWDSGSIFKLRNAKELDALLTALVNWDAPRTAEISNAPTSTSFISMKDDLISPNPNQLNITDTSDPGTRIDQTTGAAITQLEQFRSHLRNSKDANGFIKLPFNTALLEDGDGNFFRGADYFADGSINPGLWRDKILSIKVNLIATDGTATPTSKNGSLRYGGLTFLRTRRPLAADRSYPPLPDPDNPPKIQDFAGEFTVSPFRYWDSNNFDNRFVPLFEQSTSLSLAYSGGTARTETGEDILGDTFKNVRFAERSVAATGWTLVINPGVDIEKLTDIELIIRHRYSERLQPLSN